MPTWTYTWVLQSKETCNTQSHSVCLLVWLEMCWELVHQSFNNYCKVAWLKVNWSRYRPGVAQKVGRGVALLFHDHGTRRGWLVSSTRVKGRKEERKEGKRKKGRRKEKERKKERERKKGRWPLAKEKVKWSRYRPSVAQKMGRGIALLFHDRGTRRGWWVSITPRPHFTPGKNPVPIVQEVGWAPGPVWTGGKSRPPPGFFFVSRDLRIAVSIAACWPCGVPAVGNMP